MCGITKITKVADLGNTPAKVNRVTGELYISEKHFSRMSPIQRKFVLFHEQGHCLLNTTSEEAADNYAVDELLKRGYPLSEILKSLTRVLTYNSPEHRGRTLIVFNKLREYDYHVNGNTKVLINNTKTKMKTPTINVYDEQYNYTSNAIGAVIGGIMTGVQAVGAIKNVFSGGGGGSGTTNIGLIVVDKYFKENYAGKTLTVAEFQSLASEAASKYNISLAQFKSLLSKHNINVQGQSVAGGGAAGGASALPNSGANSPAKTSNELGIWEEHKTKIIVAIIIILVVAFALWYSKRKGKKS